METPNPSCAARVTLDDQQRAAVETASRKALVLAGAGSGKTRVLVERIALLIERGASPSEILAITFTRKAAGEMRERLEKRVGPAAHGVTMGTMHALALRQLNRFGELIGLKPDNITVYSQWEEEFLLEETAREIGVLRGKKWSPAKKDIEKAFALYYQAGIEPAEFDPAYPLFKAFMQRCRENNSLTYGGLLTGLLLLLPQVSQYLGWKHVLVDEVQDLDLLQWGLIMAMVKRLDATLFCVGDVSQAIYEWRGAAPKYLIEHQDEFDIYRLQRNYRSRADIVLAANALIKNNLIRLPLEMVPMVESDSPGDVYIENNLDSARTAELVQKALGNGAKPGEIAILARNHKLLAKVSRLLTEADVPNIHVGQKSALTNTEEFRRFHAFLKLIVNPFDNFAFLLVKDFLGLSREGYSGVRVKAAQEAKSHFQAWVENDERCVNERGEDEHPMMFLSRCRYDPGLMACSLLILVFLSPFLIPDHESSQAGGRRGG